MISAGVHSDKKDGQIALRNLVYELSADDMSGSLIPLPAATVFSVEGAPRTSSVDNGNLNRLFPGNPSGQPAKMIAHAIAPVICGWRHMVANFFCDLENFRRIAMRSDKTDIGFFAMAHACGGLTNSLRISTKPRAKGIFTCLKPTTSFFPIHLSGHPQEMVIRVE